ncbi:MAG: ATP-binding protein [Mucinivorans sp.]
MNQKIKLFLYFASVFVIFTLAIIVQQQEREKEFRQEALLARLDIYSTIAEHNPLSYNLPPNIRITRIDHSGHVTLDNSVDSSQKIVNHFSRHEIKQAKILGSGHDIRVSSTTGKRYLYYARRTTDGYIRVALPITSDNISLLQTSGDSIALALILFAVAMVFLWIISRRFGSNIINLRGAVIKGQAQKEELKAEMTASIAHELRTPIATIRAYTETLLDENLSTDERQQFTERTHAAAIRLSDLVRDISLLSRLDNAAQMAPNETVNLYQMTAAIEQEFAPLIKENSVSVENLLPHTLTFCGNHTLLHSIFANLIENSVKYGGKWITVRVELIAEQAGRLDLRISDTGIGIEQRHLDRIFERFYRADSGRARGDGGSGLGLSIVRHAVLYHHGAIRASVAEGGGLVVDFTLQ